MTDTLNRAHLLPLLLLVQVPFNPVDRAGQFAPVNKEFVVGRRIDDLRDTAVRVQRLDQHRLQPDQVGALQYI